MKGKFSASFSCALDVKVLLYEALSHLPCLLGLRGPTSWYLEAASACAIQTQCPSHDSIYLALPLLDQGTHLLKDRAQVSYEAGKNKS